MPVGDRTTRSCSRRATLVCCACRPTGVTRSLSPSWTAKVVSWTTLWPAITPGGEAVLYTVWSGSLDTAQVGVRALHDDRERILIAGSQPRYTSTGHIIFAREAFLVGPRRSTSTISS